MFVYGMLKLNVDFLQTVHDDTLLLVGQMQSLIDGIRKESVVFDILT